MLPIIKAAAVVPNIAMGGADYWLLDLLQGTPQHGVEWSGVVAMRGTKPSDSWPYAGTAMDCPMYDRFSSCCPVCLSESIVDPSPREILDSADVIVTWGVDLGAHRLTEDIHVTSPVVVVAHGTNNWSRDIARAAMHHATHAAAVCQNAARLFGFSPVKVIYNGANRVRCLQKRSREEVRKRWGFLPHEILVGHYGRIASEKSPLSLARAVAIMGDSYRAVYVGDFGEESRSIRAAIRDVAGRRAKFVGRCDQPGDALRAIDVLVLASESEGCPLSVLEAWYCGTPVVSTSVGAIPELERLAREQLYLPIAFNPTAMHLADAITVALQPNFKAVTWRASQFVRQNNTDEAVVREWARYLIAVADGDMEVSK